MIESETVRRVVDGYLEAHHDDAPPALGDFFPVAPPAAVDLIASMLRYDPEQRPSARALLDHPYFEPYHSGVDESGAVTHFEPVPVWDAFRGADIEAQVLDEAVLRSPLSSNLVAVVQHCDRGDGNRALTPPPFPLSSLPFPELIFLEMLNFHPELREATGIVPTLSPDEEMLAYSSEFVIPMLYAARARVP